MEKYNSILLVGPGGSGKSTQAGLLEGTGKFVYLSTGEVIRNLGDESYFKRRFKRNMDLKSYDAANRNVLGMVQGDISRRIIGHAFDPNSQKLCIDGFPRRETQIYLADSLLEVEKVLYLNIPEEVSRQRITERGENGERPKDLKPEFIEAKLRRFYIHTMKVINHYAQQGLVTEIDGNPPAESPEISKQEVHLAIMKCLGLA